MRNSLVATTGLKLVRSANPRLRAGRRRLILIMSLLALAGVGAAFGVVTAPAPPSGTHIGPLSYFPYE